MRSGCAGTLESSDVLVTVTEGEGVRIRVESIVDAFFHDQIVAAVRDELARLGIAGADVLIQDRGALDCTLRARLRTAVARMGGNR